MIFVQKLQEEEPNIFHVYDHLSSFFLRLALKNATKICILNQLKYLRKIETAHTRSLPSSFILMLNNSRERDNRMHSRTACGVHYSFYLLQILANKKRANHLNENAWRIIAAVATTDHRKYIAFRV